MDDFEYRIVQTSNYSMFDFGFYGQERQYAIVYFMFSVFTAILGYLSTDPVASIILLGSAIVFAFGFIMMFYLNCCFTEPILLTVIGSIISIFFILIFGGLILWVMTNFTTVEFNWYLAFALGLLFTIMLSIIRGSR